MVWVQLVIAVALFVIGELLRKPPPDAVAANFEDFGFPDVDPSKRIPIIWGKKRIQSLHTMDVQGYRTGRIRVKSGLFGGKTTVGHRYVAGIMIGVCRGDATGVTVRKIILDDKVIWEGAATPTDAGFVININDSDFHGADDGISGTIRVYAGTPTQDINEWFEDKHDEDSLPSTAYRNVCYLAFEDFYWGNNPTVGQIEVVATRYPNTLGIGAGRIINTTANESPTQGAVDLAIPEIINEILTDDDWGLAESAVNDIDIPSFTAAATELSGEANAMSLIWNDGDSIHDLLKIVMQQADGFVFKRMSTGLWEMNLARDDYIGSPAQLIEFDEDNSQMIRFSRGSWDETINIINLNWSDRDLKGRAVPAHEQDMSNIDIQLGRQTATYTFPGCHSATLAGTLAARQLRATGYPLIMAELTTNRVAWDLNPGDVIRFSWLQLGISDVFMRINKISLGTPENGEIRLNLIQDVFGIGRTTFGPPQPSLGVPQAGAPVDVVTALVEDQSSFMAQQDPDNPLLREKPMALAKAPQGNALEWIPHVKLAADSTYVEQSVAWGYAGNGVLDVNLPLDSTLVLGSPVSDDEDSIGALDVTLVDATDAAGGPFTDGEQKELGAGMILIESSASPQGLEYEMCSFTRARINGTTVTLVDVQRAVEDTVPREALIGDRVWFMAGSSGTSVTTYEDTDDLDIRLENIATTGRTGIGSAITFGQQLRRRLDRPFPSGGSKYGSDATTPVRYPGNTIVQPGDILVTFNRRNKNNVTLYWQDDADDTVSPLTEYDVSFYDAVGGTLTFLRTITVTAASVTYTKAQQSTDGGPFSRYMVRIQASDVSAESPGLDALDHVDRVFRYNPLISPLPSPLPVQGFSPQSPVASPHKSPSSPVPSPISPVQSPISPVTSPISPLPSPRSPAPSPRSPAPSPRSPAPSPRSPNPSPKSSPAILPTQHGYRGFIIAELPTAYWPFNDFQDVESPANDGVASPVPTQTFIEEVGGIVTESHGPVAAENRPLTKDNTDYSAGSSGESGWIQAADNLAYDFADTWSLELWFASGLADGSDRVLLQRYFGAGNAPLISTITGSGGDVGKFRCDFRDADASAETNVRSRERLDDGQAHHILMTQDVSGGDAPINLYVDGHFDSDSSAEGSPSIGKPFDNSDPFLFLGSDISTKGVRGLLAHVAIYDRVLSATDVLDHYMEGVRWTPFYSKAMKMGLHNWWRLHDIDNSAGALVLDWGSYGQDGVMINTPTVGAAGPLGGSQRTRAITFNDNNSPQTRSPVGGHVELPNDFAKLGSSPNPESGMFAAWFRRRDVNSPNEEAQALIVGANATGVWSVKIDASNQWVLTQTDGTNSATLTVDSKWTVAVETYGHIGIVADGTTKVRFYIDGSLVPDGDVSEALGGSGANTFWLGDVVAASGAEPWSWHIGLSVFDVVASSPGNTDSIWHGEISEVMFLHDEAPTAKDIMELYTSGLASFDSMTEALRQTDPYHLVEVSDGTTNLPDEIDNIADGVWAGTRIESQLPMAADDDTFSVYFTKTARTYLEWASDSWMSALSDVGSPLGVMPKAHSILLTFNREEIQGLAAADRMMLISNTTGSNNGLNMFVETDEQGIGMDLFPPSAKGLAALNNTVMAGRSVLYAFIQNAKVRGSPQNSPEDDSYRRIFLAGDEVLYRAESADDNDRNYVEEYGTAATYGVNVETRLGDWAANTSGQRNFGGLMGHATAWSHNIADEVARRLARRLHGFQEFPLMVMQHSPEIYWRMDDSFDPNQVEDHSGNLRNSDSFGVAASALFDQPADNSNLYHEDAGVMDASLGGAGILESQVLNVDAAKTVGGWFRVPTDSPISSAFAALYDNAGTNRYQEFGIVDIAGNYRTRYAGSSQSASDNSPGVTNLTAGTWYFIVWTIDAASTTVTTYLNANIEVAADTVADITGETYNRFAVNTREDGEGNGSYHDVFVIPRELTQSEIVEIYSRAFVPSYDNWVIHHDLPIAYWKLDDGWQAGQENRFYNSIPNAAGHIEYGDGALGSPIDTAGVRGIVPNYVGLATTFEGTSGINTNWRDYPQGSLPFSLTWFMFGAVTWPTTDDVVWSFGDPDGAAGTRVHAQIVSSGTRLRIGVGVGGLREWTLPSATNIHHFAVVSTENASPRSTTGIELYIDGLLQTEVAVDDLDINVGQASPTDTMHIGVLADGTTLPLTDVTMSRLAFFDKALTIDEVRAQYDAGSNILVESP